jgi:predicted phage terminase large subunit-like protein
MSRNSEFILAANELFSEITPDVFERMTDQERTVINAQFSQLRLMMAAEDYYSYAVYVHGNDWIHCAHQKFLAGVLQDFVETDTGHPYDILIVNEPSQHGKSRIFTETFPSWYMGKFPKKRVINTAYNDDLANKFGRLNRDKIRQYGGSVFGIKLAKEPNSVSNFMLDNMVGACLSKGMRSGITGNPGELILIDDPFKDQADANSVVSRNRVWTEWETTFKPRMAARAKVIVVKTRWHEDGFVGRLVKSEGLVQEGGKVTHINLPCEAEEDDPLGRNVGDPLAPELGKDKAWLEEMKSSYINGKSKGGRSAWYALYQGHPRILEGNMFKEAWFNFWYLNEMHEKPGPYVIKTQEGKRIEKIARPMPREFDEIIQSWDCTFKDEMTSDFVVGTVWGRWGIDYFLLDMVRKQMDIVDTTDAIEILSRKWPLAKLKLVEDKANGPAVIQLLRNKVTGMVPVPANKSKAGRAQATQPDFESGHVYIPHPEVHEWALDVIDEFTGFPNATYDDIVDSCVHALNRFDNSTANQTRIGNSANYVSQTGEGWKPRVFNNPMRRVAKGRARII